MAGRPPRRGPGRPRKEVRDAGTSDPMNNRPSALDIINEQTRKIRESGTTPRDLFDMAPDGWDAPSEVKKNIVVEFFSRIFLQRRPMLTGVLWDIWKPVTREVIRDLGLTFNTRQFKDETGQPEYGVDMEAWWTTRELYNEQKMVWKASTRPYDGTQDFKEKVRGKFAPGTELIGSIRQASQDQVPTEEELRSQAGSQEAESERAGGGLNERESRPRSIPMPGGLVPEDNG